MLTLEYEIVNQAEYRFLDVKPHQLEYPNNSKSFLYLLDAASLVSSENKSAADLPDDLFKTGSSPNPYLVLIPSKSDERFSNLPMKSTFKHIVLIARQNREGVAETLQSLADFLRSQNIKLSIERSSVNLIDDSSIKTIEYEDLGKYSDLVIDYGLSI